MSAGVMGSGYAEKPIIVSMVVAFCARMSAGMGFGPEQVA